MHLSLKYSSSKARVLFVKRHHDIASFIVSGVDREGVLKKAIFKVKWEVVPPIIRICYNSILNSYCSSRLMLYFFVTGNAS